MKTAMQELIEYMHELNTRPYVNGTTFMEGTIKYAKQMIEKEKEQIINTFNYGYYCASSGTDDEFELKGSIYYNQTYNQNK
jgi:hypothetical protein